MTNLEIIKSTYQGRNSQENEMHLQKHLSKNVIWIEAEGFPYAGTYIGYEQISKHVFARLKSEWDYYKFIPDNYLSDQNKIIAYGTYYGLYKKTNRSFEARVAHLWTLKNQKIIRLEQFVDSKIVYNAIVS